MLDERELWKKISAGNAQAFDTWYRETAPRLHSSVIVSSSRSYSYTKRSFSSVTPLALQSMRTLYGLRPHLQCQESPRFNMSAISPVRTFAMSIPHSLKIRAIYLILFTIFFSEFCRLFLPISYNFSQ